MRHEIESGYHPDADQISAFVEHALPAHEQQQMLAHLAVCPECRATVTMSMPLENELPAPAEEQRNRWFAGWRLAMPVAAFAAIAFLIVFLVRDSSRRQQALRTHVQIATLQAPAPSAIAPPSIKPAQPPAAQKTKPIERPTSSEEKASRARQSIARRDVISQQQLKSIPSTNLAVNQVVQTVPLAKTSPTVTGSFSTGESAGHPVQQSTAIAAASVASEDKSAAPVEATGGIIGGLETTARNSVLSSLPSGYPILSEATHLRQILAIDTQHNLFLSDDAGATWEAVSIQWKGRAVRASLVSYGSPSAGSMINGKSFRRTADKKQTSNPIPPSAPKPSPSSLAQASGIALTGTVSDQTGAAIPGASVTATSPAGQPARTATSDANGHFVLDNLAPGAYDVKTRASGFQEQLTQGVQVSATQPNVANVTLSVGSSAQTVEVQAATPRLDTVEPPAFDSAQSSNSLQAEVPAIFEIVTDNGEQWTSSDGMNWKRK